MVDSTSAAIFTFNSTNGGTSDLCGNPSPIYDSINTNYNDTIISLDVTVPHSGTSLTVEIVANLIGSKGAWGIR